MDLLIYYYIVIECRTDQEKDRLVGELHSKAEQNLHLTQELNAKIRQIEEHTLFINELEAALEYELLFQIDN